MPRSVLTKLHRTGNGHEGRRLDNDEIRAGRAFHRIEGIVQPHGVIAHSPIRVNVGDDPLAAAPTFTHCKALTTRSGSINTRLLPVCPLNAAN